MTPVNIPETNRFAVYGVTMTIVMPVADDFCRRTHRPLSRLRQRFLPRYTVMLGPKLNQRVEVGRFSLIHGDVDQGRCAMALFWLSDEAWLAIEPHLPRNQPGAWRVDDRRVISGILHVLKVGCRGCDYPAEYGPSTTVYNRFNRWSHRRFWASCSTRWSMPAQ